MLLGDVPWYVHGLNLIVLLIGIFMILLVLLVTSAAYLDITHPVANPFG